MTHIDDRTTPYRPRTLLAGCAFLGAALLGSVVGLAACGTNPDRSTPAGAQQVCREAARFAFDALIRDQPVVTQTEAEDLIDAGCQDVDEDTRLVIIDTERQAATARHALGKPSAEVIGEPFPMPGALPTSRQGSFCAPEGEFGITETGTVLECIAEPGEDRPRWRQP